MGTIVSKSSLAAFYASVAVAVLLAGCSSGGSQVTPGTSFGAPTASLAKSSIWSVVPSPNAPPGSDGLYDDTLLAVDGDSPQDVWAVGNDCCYTYGSQEYTHALIEHWNGSAWSIVPFPKDEPPDTALHAVAAISKTDAWAVGNSFYPNNQAVIFHWNGKKWSVVSSPYVYNNATLHSIVAISPNNVWAAGEGNYAALLEHWNGKVWSFVPGVTYGGVTILNSIAATGPKDIMAVGEFFPSTNLSFFAEHWNGSKWTNATPFSTFFQSAFASVTAVSANNYWTVGWEEPNQTNQVPQTLAEHWNGSKFTLVPTPNKDPKNGYLLYNVLAGVVAQSSSDVWSVGTWTYYPGSGTSRSLFERWNGKAWRMEPGPPSLESSNNNTFNQLFGIAKLRSGGLWAVGNQVVPNYGDETLTVQTTHQ
jgi:hypothetical protein